MNKNMNIEMNNYLANAQVFYVKLHNLHWNVVGKDFKPVHEYLESLYDAFADVYDEVAESLKMNGQQPLASMKEYLEVATVKELSSKELSSADVIKIALADMELLKAQAESIRTAADVEDLYDVVDLMEDHLGNYNKTIWFMHAMLK